jgi:Ethanolamine utilization protein EutJ (predicted chaperonin)
MAKATKKATEETTEHKGESVEVHPHVKGVFEKMPHIHTIWVDAAGEWRFYETPGAKAIERADINE